MSDLPSALPLRQRKPLRILTDVPLSVGCSSDNSSSGSSPPSNRNITPRTAPSTGIPHCFFHALCLHDFKSSDPAHLPFYKDEVLTIIKQEHSGWWAATRSQGDCIGWIPSSFVLPLDGGKIVEYPDETPVLRSSEKLNDYPLSAVHDPWVPVYEDRVALSFRLPTPTDLVLCKDFFDGRARSYNCELFPSPRDDEQSYMDDVFMPPTPESPSPRRVSRPYPRDPSPLEPGLSQLTRPANPNVALQHYPRSFRVDDQTPRLNTPVNLDETTPELVSGSDAEGLIVVLKSVVISQSSTHSRDGAHDRPFELPTDFRSTGPDQSADLITRGPHQMAEQLCVLMHVLYATICQNDCLDWIAARECVDGTGLQHFFDVHDYVASWVSKSIRAHDDITRQTETLDFWIGVAERCHSLRNFDSLCAIILALSRSSLPSLRSTWAQFAHKQTLATLRDMLDVENKPNRLVDIIDAAAGPSVPFVRGYLDHIEQLSDKLPHPNSGHAADVDSSVASCTMQLAAVSALLRHQSSPYGFRITESIRSFIDDVLRAID